jgi:hypothetical protein
VEGERRRRRRREEEEVAHPDALASRVPSEVVEGSGCGSGGGGGGRQGGGRGLAGGEVSLRLP